MSIHRRKTKKGFVWDVRYRDGDRNRGRAFDTKADAQAFEAELVRRKRFGAHAPSEPSSALLSDFIEHWIRTSGPTWAAQTQRTRVAYVEKWIDPYIGNVRLRDLGRARVREWRADIVRDGSRPVNTNNVVRVLSAALSTAVDEGLIPWNPCFNLGKIPEPPANRRAFDPATVKKIIAAMPTDRDKLIVAFMAYAGLRPAEVVGLRWGDVGNTIHVWNSVQDGSEKSTKSLSTRAVPINQPLRRLITKLKPAHAHDDDLVAPPARGKFLNWKMWGRNVWGDARETLGLDGVPYDLRHTAASTWIMRGEDLLTVASWLGHSPKVTLDHYAHLFAEARSAPATNASPKKRAAAARSVARATPAATARGRRGARGTGGRP